MRKQLYQVFINITSAPCALTIISIASNSSNIAPPRLTSSIINLTKAIEVPLLRRRSRPRRPRRSPVSYDSLISRRTARSLLRARAPATIIAPVHRRSFIILIGGRRRRCCRGRPRISVSRPPPRPPPSPPPPPYSVLPTASPPRPAYPAFTPARYTGIITRPPFTPFKPPPASTRRRAITHSCPKVRRWSSAVSRCVGSLLRANNLQQYQ